MTQCRLNDYCGRNHSFWGGGRGEGRWEQQEEKERPGEKRMWDNNCGVDISRSAMAIYKKVGRDESHQIMVIEEACEIASSGRWGFTVELVLRGGGLCLATVPFRSTGSILWPPSAVISKRKWEEWLLVKGALIDSPFLITADSSPKPGCRLDSHTIAFQWRAAHTGVYCSVRCVSIVLSGTCLLFRSKVSIVLSYLCLLFVIWTVTWRVW